MALAALIITVACGLAAVAAELVRVALFRMLAAPAGPRPAAPSVAHPVPAPAAAG